MTGNSDISGLDGDRPKGTSMMLEYQRLSETRQIARSLPILHPLECRVDSHGVAVPQSKVLLEPGDNCACLYAGFEQAFVLSNFPEIFRSLAGLCLDVVDVRLE